MKTAVNRLAQRVRELAPSQTLALSARANALKAQGKAVINFSVGEPDFGNPQCASDEAKAAIERGESHYTPVPGTKQLKDAIVKRYERDFGVTLEGDQVIASNGAKHTLYNLMQVLVDPGDEVLFASPYWVSYPAMVALAGGRPVPIATRAEESFRLDPEAVEAAITPRTKVLILNSPSNPTGSVAEPADLEAVVRLAIERDVVVVSDEIYSGLVFDGAVHKCALTVDHPRVAEQVVVVDGVSKTYAMTGWRIGYCVGPKDVVSACSKIQSQSTSGASSIAQAAAAGALNEGAADVARMHAAFAERRQTMLSQLRALPGVRVPEARGAFYAFPDLSAYYGSTIDGQEVTGSLSLSEILLEKALVAAVPGVAFGADAHLRLSYAVDPETIVAGIGRIREVLARAEPQPS